MADPFPVSGNIDSTSFPHLLVDLHRQGATGSLKVNGPVHPKALYFRGGRVLFGSSNDPRDQLGAILIESGKITREQLDEVNEKVGPGNPLAKVLAESGFVNQRELGDAARVKVERILSDVISWASGTFEFEDGVLPKGAVDLKLSTERLLLAAVQRIADREFALRHLGGGMTTVLEAVPEGEEALTDVRAEVWPLLERLDGERTLRDAVALTRLDEFDAAKTACAMVFLGIVRRKDTDGSELDLAEQALSGFGEQPAEGGGPDTAAPPPPEPQPGPVIVPSDAAPSFSILDSEPAPEPPAGFPSAAPEPGPEEPEPEAPVGFMAPEPDEPVGVLPEPEAPAGFVSPEPSEPEGAAPAPTVEPTGFAFSEPGAPEPAGGVPSFPAPSPLPPGQEPTMALPVEPPAVTPEPPPPPPMEAPVPSFTVDPPSRKEVDTVPGDRPVYVPPAAEPPASVPESPVGQGGPEISLSAPGPAEAEPSAPAPAPSPPDSAARPTQEDLAALDALLNPSASGKTARVAERPRAEKWEPQFRTGGPSATFGTSAASRRAVGRRTRGSRAPLFAGLAGLVIAGVAAGYFLLGRSSEPTLPAPPSTPPTAAPTPALSAPATVAAAPSPMATPTPPEAGAPTPAATAVAPAPVAAATPTPPPAPPPTPPPAAPAGDALALLRQGAFDQSAQASAASLSASAQGGYSIQVLAACSPDTIRKAAQSVSGDEIFILPVTLNGRACFRVCWGVYDSREAAQAGIGTLPDYFRQSGISPRISPLVELLP